MGQPIRCEVWQGIDRLAFFEAAILLEIKSRSQGDPIKFRAPAACNIIPDISVLGMQDDLLRHFLDDFALLASGAGGKDNVSSACIDIPPTGGNIVLRVARNDGVGAVVKQYLDALTSTMMTRSASVQDILLLVVERCNSRVRRKIEKMENAFKLVNYPPAKDWKIPPWTAIEDSKESPHDIREFGTYCETSSGSYMEKARSRLESLMTLSSQLRSLPKDSTHLLMSELLKVAYDIRRSSSFRRYLTFNIPEAFQKNKTDAQKAIEDTTFELLERIGHLGKFYRAAVTLDTVGKRLLSKEKTLSVVPVDTHTISVPELGDRTSKQIRARGGPKFNNINECQFRGMLGRWDRYRQHAEIQLLVFYEENFELTPCGNYIGCSKQCCYLCYKFIELHGRFRVSGCHQSLYSLWCIPELVSFANLDRVRLFQDSLSALGRDLQSKLDCFRILQGRRMPRFKPNNESVANLSRVTLATNLSTQKPIQSGAQSENMEMVVEEMQDLPRATSVRSGSHSTLRNRKLPESPPMATNPIHSEVTQREEPTHVGLVIESADEELTFRVNRKQSKSSRRVATSAKLRSNGQKHSRKINRGSRAIRRLLKQLFLDCIFFGNDMCKVV